MAEVRRSGTARVRSRCRFRTKVSKQATHEGIMVVCSKRKLQELHK